MTVHDFKPIQTKSWQIKLRWNFVIGIPPFIRIVSANKKWN